jgi:hypothetical protein
MKVLINYANDTFQDCQKINSNSGLRVGLFDKVISYSPKDIERDFFDKNRKILSQARGNGYWLWKPYFIKKTLDMLSSEDLLFYSDSGSYFVRPISTLIDGIRTQDHNRGLVAFELQHAEKAWTKRDAFILMDCDSTTYSESNQRLASFNLWRKTPFTIGFINEYLFYAQDERIITDLENQCGYANYPEFNEHRHDQSIFSLLTKKYGLSAYRDPSQYGNETKHYYANSNYEQIIEHTRKTNASFSRKPKLQQLDIRRMTSTLKGCFANPLTAGKNSSTPIS